MCLVKGRPPLPLARPLPLNDPTLKRPTLKRPLEDVWPVAEIWVIDAVCSDSLISPVSVRPDTSSM